MSTITWSDGLASRSRKPWLLLVRGDEIVAFAGETIPGLAVVRGTDYTKNGKWSYTTYRIELANGVRCISGHLGWETGRFDEGLGRAVGRKTPDTWSEMAEALGVSVPTAMEFLRSWRPGAATKLDKVDEALATLEKAGEGDGDETVIVTVSFRRPKRADRQWQWVSPKPIPGFDAEIRMSQPEVGWEKGNIEVAGMTGTVLSVKKTVTQYEYYAVSVAVLSGTETPIPCLEESPAGDSNETRGLGAPSAPSADTTTMADAMRRAGLI